MINQKKVNEIAQKKGLKPNQTQAAAPVCISDVIDLDGGAALMVTRAINDSMIEWNDALLDEEDRVMSLGKDPYGYMHSFVAWGPDNLMPVHISSIIGSDETVNSSLDALKRICYGGGIKFENRDAEGPIDKLADEVNDWFDEQDLSTMLLRQAKNLKTFAWGVDVLLLNYMGDKITDIYSRDTDDIRLAPHAKENVVVGTFPVRKGTIPFAYYGKFNYYKDVRIDMVETICLLDERRPLQDLKVLMGKERGANGLYMCDDPNRPAGRYGDIVNYPLCRCRKFGIVRKMPTVESRFYAIPSYAACIKGSWLQIKHAIETSLKAKIANGSQIKYLITVHPDYWQSRLNQEGLNCTLDSEKGRDLVARVKNEWRDYLTGASNNNKTIMAGQSRNPITGEAVDLVKITTVDNKTQGGDWKEDITEATNMLCYGMGIHPSLVGAVPGKSGNNNSGSDKREMYTIAQSNELSTRDVLLMSYKVVLKYNGWWKKGIRVCMPFMQLTTLDEHQSAKQVTGNDPSHTNNSNE